MPNKLVRRIGRKLRKITAPKMVSIGIGSNIDFSVAFYPNHGPIDIGARVQILRGGHLLGPVTIGYGTYINEGCYIRAHTTIAKNVTIGAFVRFLPDTHEISDTVRRAGEQVFKPIFIDEGAWIGAGAFILGGITVGRGAIVGAGSVVTKDVASDTVVGGNPARVIRLLDPPLATVSGENA